MFQYSTLSKWRHAWVYLNVAWKWDVHFYKISCIGFGLYVLGNKLVNNFHCSTLFFHILPLFPMHRSYLYLPQVNIIISTYLPLLNWCCELKGSKSLQKELYMCIFECNQHQGLYCYSLAYSGMTTRLWLQLRQSDSVIHCAISLQLLAKF